MFVNGSFFGLQMITCYLAEFFFLMGDLTQALVLILLLTQYFDWYYNTSMYNPIL